MLTPPASWRCLKNELKSNRGKSNLFYLPTLLTLLLSKTVTDIFSENSVRPIWIEFGTNSEIFETLLWFDSIEFALYKVHGF